MNFTVHVPFWGPPIKEIGAVKVLKVFRQDPKLIRILQEKKMIRLKGSNGIKLGHMIIHSIKQNKKGMYGSMKNLSQFEIFPSLSNLH